MASAFLRSWRIVALHEHTERTLWRRGHFDLHSIALGYMCICGAYEILRSRSNYCTLLNCQEVKGGAGVCLGQMWR